MQELNPPLGRVVFEPYEVDFRTGELRKHGVRIRLQAQPLRVLEMLMERRGNVVTREELKGKLWPADTFGDFDHGLNKAINKLREALADSALNPRYVETVARRGYRFIPVLTEVDQPARTVEPAIPDRPAVNGNSQQPAEKPAAPRGLPTFLAWKIAGACLAVFFAVFVVFYLHSMVPGSANIRSLAVLPLENLSSDVSQEYFADGMTDELITALATINGLKVISRTSVMLYKHARKPLPQIGRELKVDAIVEGTVLRSGEHVRITAQLIRATADEHIWSQSYEGDLSDTLQLQDKVARAIADRIRLKITAQEQALLQKPKLVNPDAHDAYLKGRYFWNKRTEQSLKEAIAYFDQAISKDPNYAPAYSGLADSYTLLADWEYGALDRNEAFPKAKAAATKALKLDDNLGEAHASLGLCRKAFDWDWRGAKAELLRAIELSPSYATAHQWYGWSLLIGGQDNEAISELEKAEALDPLSLIISADLADALTIAHRYDESIRQSRRAIEMDPSFAMAHYQLGQALGQARNYDEAIRELQQAIELSRANPLCTSQLGFVYAVSGRRNEALKILNDLKIESNDKSSHAVAIAVVYAGLNDKDQALAWLQTAYQERFNPSALVRPAFDVLRSDSRFQNLLHRCGLS